MRLKTIGGAIFVVMATAPNALGSPSSKLTYVRGVGAELCPDEKTLRSAVAARLGYDPFFPWAKKTIVAQIDRASSGFRGMVQILDEDGVALGERVVVSPASDCRELLTTLALAISISIDDLIDDESPKPTQNVTPNLSPPNKNDLPEVVNRPLVSPSLSPPKNSAPPVSPRKSAPTALEVSVGFLGAVGTAPAPSFGARIGFGLSHSFFSVVLEGRSDLPASKALANGRVESSLALGGLVPCLHGGRYFFGCGLLALGSFKARSQDVAFPVESRALFSAAGVRIGMELPIAQHLAATLSGEALFTFTPHRLEFDDREVFALPRVSASLSAGIRARFF